MSERPGSIPVFLEALERSRIHYHNEAKDLWAQLALASVS